MFTDGTFVKHMTEGYQGIVDGTTSMKELFTGNTAVARQYRVKMLDSEVRRVAPEEDLEEIEAPIKPGSRVVAPDPQTGFRSVSFMKAEGYDLEVSQVERQRILTKVIGAQGLFRVVSFIVRSLMYNRTKDIDRARRYSRSLNQWNDDVAWMMKTFVDHKDYASTRKMLDNQIKELTARGYKWVE